MSGSRLRPVVAWTAALVLAAGVLASCSSDDGDDTSTDTTAGPTTTAESAQTVAFDKMIQQQLRDVDCYSGEVDGIMGPATDAAIVAFQTAKGLHVDGELGPETDTALRDAAESGEKVCGTPTDTTAAPTTTTVAGGSAPCTATAIQAALPSGSSINSYVCSEGYAGGGYTIEGEADAAFLLKSDNGAWTDDSQACGAASAGIPPQILEAGCAS